MHTHTQASFQSVVDDHKRGELIQGSKNGRKRSSGNAMEEDPALARHNEKRRRSITMKLSKTGESKVIGYVISQL